MLVTETSDEWYERNKLSSFGFDTPDELFVVLRDKEGDYMRKMIWMLGLFLIFSDIGWGAEQWTIVKPPTIPPKKSILSIGVGCYDAWTLLPLDCRFSFSLKGVELSGGHIHYDRPVGGLKMSGDSGAGANAIDVYTAYKYLSVEYVVPEAAGEVILDSTITPPYGYRCLNPSDCKYEGTIDIKVGGLETMPVSGQGYWRLTGSYGEPGVTSLHFDNHYGTPSTKVRLAVMASDYFEDTGIAIGVNDMSLEWGGLFDINNNWATPHIWHRTGKSVDVDHLGVKEDKLDKIAEEKYQCDRHEVDRIHYECP